MKIYKKIFYVGLPLLTFSCDPSKNREDEDDELKKMEKIAQQRTPQELTKTTSSGKIVPPPTNNPPKNTSPKKKKLTPPQRPPYVKPTKDEVQTDETVKKIFVLPQNIVDIFKENGIDEKTVKNRIVERKILETFQHIAPYEKNELFIILISFFSCLCQGKDYWENFKTEFLTKMSVLIVLDKEKVDGIICIVSPSWQDICKMGELEDLFKDDNRNVLEKFFCNEVEFCLKNSEGNEIGNGKFKIQLADAEKIEIGLEWNEKNALSADDKTKSGELISKLKNSLSSQYSILEKQIDENPGDE